MKKQKYNPLIEDKKENINLFSDITDPKKYSKYSNQLNKVFSSYSYSKFINDLTRTKVKKQITLKDQINQWLNLSSYSTKFRLDNFDINDFKSKIKETEEKNLLLSQEKRKKYIDKRVLKRKLLSQMTKDKVLKIKNKYKFKQSPCLGVYNPIYDAIGKHSYQVTFEKQNFTDFNNNKDKSRDKYNLKKTDTYFNIRSIKSDNKKNKKLINNEKKISNKTQTQIKSNNNIYKNNSKSKNIKKIITENNKENNKKKLSKKIFINGDLIVFSKVKRNKRNKSTNENLALNIFKNTLSNNSTFNNDNNNLTVRDSTSFYKIKGNVNFDKISNNKKIGSYFEEIAKKRTSPAVGTYRPIYSSIFNRTTNIIFQNKMKNDNNIKKKFLYKIITNYNQTRKYELFDILNKNSF